MQTVDFSYVQLDNLTTNEKWDIFINKIVENTLLAFPVKIITTNTLKNHTVTWFNEHLKNMRDVLGFYHDVYKQSPTNGNKILYTEQKRQYKHEIQIAKKRINSDYIKSKNNSPKSMWEVINNCRPKAHTSLDATINPDDFNNYFVNQAEVLVSQLQKIRQVPADFLNRNIKTTFKFREVTFNDVREAINKLKNKNSMDIYGINVKIIKQIKNIIIFPLTHLINLSIKAGEFPNSLKIAKVIPIFKKGNPDDPGNYRPISLVPIIAKIVEWLLAAQIAEYFENNNLFINEQFGFRQKRNTEKAILTLISKISNGFDDDTYIGGTFCDLSKAFDCVAHKTLILKLNFYGFNPLSTKLIESYLTNRQQLVHYNDKNSNLSSIQYGVPQGSILGPLLFLIYINDINDCLPNSELVLYADDTTTLDQHNNLEQLLDLMNKTQSEASSWFTANQLHLNVSKTMKCIFTLKHCDLDILPSAKFLGVYLDSRLSWETHIDQLSKKLSKNTYVLRNLYPVVNDSVILTAYYSLFHSNMSYAILAWGHSAHAKQICSLQRRAIRIITGSSYYSDIKQKFIDLKILTFTSVFVMKCLLWMRDNTHLFKQHNDIHHYDTRNNSKIEIEFHRVNKSKFSTNYYAPKLYNKLPSHIKYLPANQYKEQIKTYLTERAFYSLNEVFDDNFLFV